MAEAFNSLFKAECIRNPMMRPKGCWESVADFEIAVAEYVDGSTTDGSTARSAWSRPPSRDQPLGQH
jgi:hypothetical protein